MYRDYSEQIPFQESSTKPAKLSSIIIKHTVQYLVVIWLAFTVGLNLNIRCKLRCVQR